MCDFGITAAIISTAATVGGGVYSAVSQRKQASAQKEYYYSMADQSEQDANNVKETYGKQMDLIAGSAEQNVKSTQDQASRDTQTLKNQVKDIEGTQKVTQAANGVFGNSGSAEDVAMDTFQKSKLDELTIRHNADTKSWDIKRDANTAIWQTGVNSLNEQKNLRKQATNYRRAGDLGVTAGNINSVSTLLGAAGQTANNLYIYKKAGVPK